MHSASRAQLNNSFRNGEGRFVAAIVPIVGPSGPVLGASAGRCRRLCLLRGGTDNRDDRGYEGDPLPLSVEHWTQKWGLFLLLQAAEYSGGTLGRT